MKWFGEIGYETTVETAPGVWTEMYEVRQYFGELNRNHRRLEATAAGTNDNITINNEISIIADEYAYNNFHTIRWLEFMGNKWKVSSVDVQPPRLILSVSEVYNAETEN